MSALSEPSRLRSGISSLDDILLGGLPKGHIYLVEGDPGTGKTTLGMQFVLEGKRAGERCLYVTLSESKAELESAAQSHGSKGALLRVGLRHNQTRQTVQLTTRS